MKNISKVKQKIQTIFAQKFCNLENVSKCTKPGGCTCSMAAQTRSYIQTVVPDGYRNFDIFQFNGKSRDGESIIDPSLIVQARKKLIWYCWGDIDMDLQTATSLDKNSMMSKRREQGRNIVIFADSTSKVIDAKSRTSPRGRTFCSSIVMIQAIKSRMTKNGYIQLYDWVKYPILAQKLKKNQDQALSDIRLCDWLVIDDIQIYGDKDINTRLVDPFISQRLQCGLPTIFVCRFDAQKNNDQKSIGSGLSQVLHDKKTITVRLSKE